MKNRQWLLWSFLAIVLVGFLTPGFQKNPQNLNADAPVNEHQTPYLGITQNVTWAGLVADVQNHPTSNVGQVTIYRVESQPEKWVVNVRKNGQTYSIDAPKGETDARMMADLVRTKNAEMKEQSKKLEEEHLKQRVNGLNPYSTISLSEEGFNPVKRQFTDEHPLAIKVVGLNGPENMADSFLNGLIGMLPWLVFFAIAFFVMRNRMGGMQDPNSKASEFAKSKATLIEKTGKTMADFEGDENVKSEVENLIFYLRNPGRAQRLHAKLPRGVLFVGPPGTGKTLLAKAIAGEAGVPFFTLSGSDFVEMFVGVGSARVRDMFAEAKKKAPCIIFIDEIDAIGRHRGAGLGGGHDEREQTLNQILVEMDGFTTDDRVIVIGATNRHDILDPALLRPGRFGDLMVTVGKPDRKGRHRILTVHARQKPLTEEARAFLGELAAKTPGFAGAELEGVLNHAALVACYRIDKVEDGFKKQAAALKEQLAGKPEEEIKTALDAAGLSDEKIQTRLPAEEITVSDIMEGKWRIIAGTRGSHEMSEADRLNTAVHELGHAFSSEKDYQEDNGGEPVREINCIQRSRALGVTVTSPDRDPLGMTDKQIMAKVRMAMAGRAAQKIVLNAIDTGAANDLEQATNLIREYVMRYGMDDEVGPLHVGEPGGPVFLGKSMGAAQQAVIGDDLKNLIDRRMQALSKDAMKGAEDLIRPHAEMIMAMAQQLLKDEEWTRKDWLEELRKQGCSEKFGWTRLQYVEPKLEPTPTAK